MELGVQAADHSTLVRRATPIACGGALVVSAAFLAAHDPSTAGSQFPSCIFHQATGLWCPGCGLTRGTHQLLHGNLGAALSSNIFTPLALAAIVVAWVAWLRVSWGASLPRVPQRAVRWLAFGLPALVLAYGVLRNIPAAPFRSLAP